MDENLKRYLFHILEKIKSHKRWFVYAGILGILMGSVAGSKVENKFKSSQTISLQDEQTFNSLLKGISAPLNTKKTTRTAYSVINTIPVLNRVAEQSGMLDSNSSESEKMSVISQIQKNIEIQTAYSESEIVTVSFVSNDREQAKNVVEIISKEYINEVLKIRGKTARLVIEFLNKKIDSTQLNLKTYEDRIENLKKENIDKMPDLFIGGKKNENNIENLLFKAEIEHKEVVKRINFITKALLEYNSDLEAVLIELQNQKELIKEELEYKSEEHPDIIEAKWIKSQLEVKIKNIKKRKKRLSKTPEVGITLNEDTQIEFETNQNNVFYVTKKIQESELKLEEELLREKIQEYKKELKAQKSSISHRPTVEKEYSQLQSKLKEYKDLLKDLKKNLDEAKNSLRIAIMDAKSGHSIISPANLPLYSTSINSNIVVVVGLVIALLLCIALIMLIDFLDNKIRSKEELSEQINIPCISEIKYQGRDS